MYRDASAMVRMQKDMHNQGYAAGVAAAMAVAGRCGPRADRCEKAPDPLGRDWKPARIGRRGKSIHFRCPRRRSTARSIKLQPRKSVERPSAGHWRWCFPIPIGRAAARDAFSVGHRRRPARLCAVLGFLGDPSGAALLIERLEQIEVWDAKVFQGKMAEYAHLPTPLDSLILALGYSGDRRAIVPIFSKLEMLDQDVTLSHHRSVALALESLGAAAAAEPLARLLEKPGMRGHSMKSLEPLHDQPMKKRRRNEPLREIVLARALYHCGDWQGLGESILNEYRSDLRGLSPHATAVLTAEK